MRAMVQIIVALLLNVIATVVVVWLASRIYENTVLNIGSRVRWRDALKQGGRATKKEKTSSST